LLYNSIIIENKILNFIILNSLLKISRTAKADLNCTLFHALKHDSYEPEICDMLENILNSLKNFYKYVSVVMFP
jgi:hypothetical protein